MSWRLAESLDQLRDQVNELLPKRRKESDGTIGNAEHASRSSDHNPWVRDKNMGVVTALDLTHDPKGGFDSYLFAQSLMDNEDPRIKFIISNGKICSGTGQGHPAWKWRGYSGKNRHDHHVHISVKSDKQLYDSRLPWKFELHSEGTTTTRDYKEPPATLRNGAKGEAVKHLQSLLNRKKGFTLSNDGIFGDQTELAVRKFQKDSDLVSDGIVGPQTWRELEAQK